MVFDSLITACIAADLRQHLLGARVARVLLPEPGAAVLEFAQRADWPQLCLSWRPESARVHLARDCSPQPGLTGALGDVMRRFLRGARLVAVEQMGFDRVLRLDFTNAENLGPESRCLLVVEPIGRWANVLLLDHEGLIRECARQVPAAVNRHRQLLPGLPYVPPPGADLPGLLTADPPALGAAAERDPDQPLGRLLPQAFQGAGPTLLAELWTRSGLDPEIPAAGQPPDWAWALAACLAAVGEEALAGGAWLYRPPRGRAFAYPLRLRSRTEAQAEAFPHLSAALEEAARQAADAEGRRQRAERVQGAVQRAREQVARRRAAREKSLAQAASAQCYRQWGEALLANLWCIPPGSAEVELTQYTEQGEDRVTVPLAPPRSPQEVAQEYFRRYKKAQRAAALLPSLLEQDRREEQYLEGLSAQVETADEADLADLEEEVRRRGYLKRPSRRAAVPSGGHDYHRLTVDRGYTLWYGAAGLQNDRLLRQAHPEDLWLHVRQGPGGHVVIRTGGRPQDVPEAVREMAARLAAGLSRQRAEGQVEVACTRVKHVRKPKGTPPGFVLYDHEEGLTVAPLWPPPAGERSAEE